MKHLIITLLALIAIAYFINDLGKDANRYHYDKMHDSIEMYKQALLKHNDGKLRKNRKFTNND